MRAFNHSATSPLHLRGRCRHRHIRVRQAGSTRFVSLCRGFPLLNAAVRSKSWKDDKAKLEFVHETCPVDVERLEGHFYRAVLDCTCTNQRLSALRARTGRCSLRA
jgi:hypothetical protein